jgi:RNA 2',3'-cyclic 3'-phosphodiesterase
VELPPTIRAFVALRLSPETDRALIALIDELRAPGDGINWARPSNLHLTLRFLGAAVKSALIPPLIERLQAVAGATAPFVVAARGIGAFPDFFRPRVIWAGLESEALIALAARVEEAAVRSGFEPEQRPFAPHLTLGRVRNPRRFRRVRPKLEAAAERDFGSSQVETMTLYESRLLPTGSEYRELASFRFEQPG